MTYPESAAAAPAASWTLAVSREDLTRTRLTTGALPELQPGEALLAVDRVGVTANNVTYAVLGEAFRYWEFFPTDPGWGVVPLWGFADVVGSRVDGVEPGDRVYGYLPSASHLLVRPERIDTRGFRDASAHRATLPSPYNTYASITGDPAYEAEREDLQVLYRPLFWTSFMLADWLVDNDCFGAGVVAMSSASSKTAYGAAFELQRQGRRVIGLTSPRNVDFTAGLGCYDRVLPYDAIADLDHGVATVYADLLGDRQLTADLRAHLGPTLAHEVVVGVTGQQVGVAGTLGETGDAMFFAPDQMRKRIQDWGRDGIDRSFAQAWRSFAPFAEAHVDVVVQSGPQALEQVWREVQAGRTPPRNGHVLTL